MRTTLSGAQRRALQLQQAIGYGGCVRLDCALTFDGTTAALCSRIAALAAGSAPAASRVAADGAHCEPGTAPAVVMHRFDTLVAAEREEAFAVVAQAQLEQIRIDYRAEHGSALQIDVALTGTHQYRVLLAAPRWYADVQSLRTLVRALGEGDLAPGEPRLRYADVTELQSQLLVDPDAETERVYWRDTLRQAETFAIDAHAGGAQRSAVEVPLPAPLSATLAQAGEALWLACWLQLLEGRFGDATVVACTAAGRDVEGLDRVFGPLAITVPVAFDVGGSALLRRQRDVVERLAQARERCLYYPGLPTAADAKMRGWRYGFDWSEADSSEHACVDDGEPHALRLEIVRRAQHVELRIVFDSGQHDRNEIEWLSHQYVTLVESASRVPECRLDEHDLADVAQRDFVAGAGCGPLLQIAEADFVARLAAIVARTPDAPALHAGALRLSYAELDRWTNQIARLLLEEGVQPGRRVGICLPRCARQIVSMLGVLKAGCAYVPIDPAYPARRIARIVAQAGLALIVTTTDCLDRVSDSDVEIPLIDWVRDADYIKGLPSDAPEISIHPEQPAYAIFTSGSTGEPKGVEVSHRALTNYVSAIGERLEFARIGSIAALSTVAADLGYTAVFGGLGNGSCLRVLDEALSLDAAALAEELAAAPVDCLKIVPSHLGALLSVDAPQRVLPRECVVLGGEALPWDMVERLRALSPTLHVVNHYGPTETTIGITCNAAIGARTRTFGASLGSPLANDRTYVLDTNLRRCAVGIEGELCLAGAGVALGYLARPAETAAKFLPDPYADTPGARMYASGDRAVFDGAGELLFRGRADDQVKLRGHRVELGEIEVVVRSSTQVRECAVIVSFDDKTPRLIAYAVGDDAAEAAVRDYLAAQLPEHMQPAAWVWLERLPLNANGKLDRRALPAPSQRERVSGRSANPIEAALLQLCRELLGNERIGVDDNFFAIGADSIVAIQLVARARQQGLYFRPKQVFEQQTIARLAAVVDLRAISEGAEQGQIVGDAPLTAIQARYFASVDVDRHHYNQACMYDMPAGATFDRLQRAAARLLQHHDGLRAAFVELDDGSWRQRFAPWSPELTARCCEQVRMSGSSDTAVRAVVERVQAGFELDAAPLLRLVRIEDEAGGKPRLLAVAHHLVVDSYSWRLIEEDLHALLADPDVLLPPKTCSVRAWAERAQQALANRTWRTEADHWEHTEREIVPLPLSAGDDRVGDAVCRRLVLPDRVGVALAGSVHSAFNTNTQDFLLAALLAACADWTGTRTLGVMLEGHGREADSGDDVDCGRTVGWFTTMYPVALHAPARDGGGDDDAIALVTAVKEQLRSVPGHGSGYAALRYLGEQGAAHRAAEPELCFNYLGRFSASADAALLHAASPMHLAQHATRSVAQPRLFALEVLAVQHGEQLVVNIVHNPSRLAEATVERLCTRLQFELERLIAACGASAGSLTPSDVPDLDLQQDELDALLSELSEVV